MRYAMIMAGGTGTRLWPMSRKSMPKQLVPFIDAEAEGGPRRSLLQIAAGRLEGIVPAPRRYICMRRTGALMSCPSFIFTGLSPPCLRPSIQGVL